MKRVIGIAVALLFSPTVYAIECGDPSPFGSDAEQYLAEVEKQSLTNDEQHDIRRLFTQLEGDWSGSGVSITCKTENGEEKATEEDLEIRSTYEQIGENRLTEINELEFLSNQNIRSEKYTLHLQEGFLSNSSNVDHSTIGFVNVQDKELVYVYKTNIKAVTGGRVVIDTYTQYTLSITSMTAKVRYYANGVVSGWRVYTLKKR
ncbi:MAG: hypothetical protein AAF434_12585 [Pseudomonadota bacterium]